MGLLHDAEMRLMRVAADNDDGFIDVSLPIALQSPLIMPPSTRSIDPVT